MSEINSRLRLVVSPRWSKKRQCVISVLEICKPSGEVERYLIRKHFDGRTEMKIRYKQFENGEFTTLQNWSAC